MLKRWVILVALLGLLALSVGQAAAGARNLNLVPGCTSYLANGGSLIGERDNTGRGVESFVVRVRDGSSRLIYDLVIDLPIDGRFDFTSGARFRYPLNPRANPLRLEVVSSAGNGVSARTLYTNTATCVTLPGGSEGDALAFDPFNLPRPTNPPGVAEANEAYGIVNTDNLNLRTGDGLDYARIAVLDGGTTLILLGRNGANTAGGLWWYVEVGGLRGWVKNEFIILRGDASGIGVSDERGALASVYLILGVDNFLRTVPSPGASVLCIIPGGINYPVLAKDAVQASWFEIRADCGGRAVTGWVPAESGFLRNESGRDIPIP